MINSNIKFLIIITFIACTAGVSSDIYAPSIPRISNYLSVSISQIQSNMANFMLGLTFSQLLYGPFADIYGRKKPLILGMIIFTIGNILSVYADSILMLNISRIIQGLRAGASASLWRSMFRDKYSSTEMAKYGGYLTITITFVVPMAPLIGGYLQEIYNWQASFKFMIVYSIICMLLIILFIPEFHKISNIHKFSFPKILKNYLILIFNRIFIGYTLCSLLSFGAFFSWFVIGPVILIQHLGQNPSSFGWTALIGGGATCLSGYLNGIFVHKYGSENILKLGWILMFISGFLLLFGFYFFGINLLAISIPVAFFYFGVSFVFPNSFAKAFTPFGHIAGTAAALYGCLQTLGAVITGYISSYIPNNNQLPLAIIMITVPTLSWLIYKVLKLNKL